MYSLKIFIKLILIFKYYSIFQIPISQIVMFTVPSYHELSHILKERMTGKRFYYLLMIGHYLQVWYVLFGTARMKYI